MVLLKVNMHFSVRDDLGRSFRFNAQGARWLVSMRMSIFINFIDLSMIVSIALAVAISSDYAL